MRRYVATLLLLMLRLAISVIVVFFFFYLTDKWIVKATLPATGTIIRHAYPDAELKSLSYEEHSGHTTINVTMNIKKYFKNVGIPLIDTLSTSITASILFVPFLIYYPLLFAWPSMTIKKKIIAAIIILPILMLFFFLDTSVTLVGALEIEERKKLVLFAVKRSMVADILHFLTHFFNNGGRQFMGVFLFIISVAATHFSGRDWDNLRKNTNR